MVSVARTRMAAALVVCGFAAAGGQGCNDVLGIKAGVLSDGGVGEPCRLDCNSPNCPPNGGCSASFKCIGYVCRAPCSADADCPGGQRCLATPGTSPSSHGCVPQNSPCSSVCVDGAGYNGNQVCGSDGQCRNSCNGCLSDQTCGTGTICSASQNCGCYGSPPHEMGGQGSGSATSTGGSTSSAYTRSSATTSSVGTVTHSTASTSTGSACPPGPYAATEKLIDDMSGTAPSGVAPSISFVPPSCTTKGKWSTWTDGTISPAAAASFTYSALPAGLPSRVDAGPHLAACVSGVTGATQYTSNAGMTVTLSEIAPADGGPQMPALIDASAYSGVAFWFWASSSTVAAIASSLEVSFADKEETPGYGICNPTAAGTNSTTACGAASAQVAGQAAGAGKLLGVDGGAATLAAGWQFIEIPWAQFGPDPYFGAANEPSMHVDPTKLTALQFGIVQWRAADAGGAPVSFNFCVYDLAFY